MTTLNLRLKLTRVNALKLKVLPRFPASILTGNFLTVTSANSTYTFDIDYTKLGPGPVQDPASAMVAVLDETAGVYKIVSLASLLVSGLDTDLQAIGALTGTGILSRTADGTWALRSMVAPAAGLTITNPAGIAGNETFALANDLAALEALASTGLAVRSAADTWVQRVIAGTANEITLTNGDGISGNPTASLPAALTFTGKTVTGGTYNSPALVTPNLGVATAASLALTGSTSGNTKLIAAAVAGGTLTLPGANDVLVGRATTDTLTSKTISGASNTLTVRLANDVTGALPNANLATMTAYTLKGNATGSTAVPSDIDVTALTAKASPVSADIILIQDSAASNAFKKTTVGALSSAGSVASIAGNTGAFTLSTGLTNVGNDIRLALNSATLQVNPANPTGTSSATAVMMGLGSTCKITPTYSGRVRIEIVIGTATASTAGAGLTTTLRQGTGTAPVNGVASTGTQIGNQATTALNISANIPYSMSGIVTGLTPGVAVWFDLSLSISAGNASLASISCNAFEF